MRNVILALAIAAAVVSAACGDGAMNIVGPSSVTVPARQDQSTVPMLDSVKGEGQVWPIQSDGRNICTATSIDSVRHYWLTAAHCVATPEPAAMAANNAIRKGRGIWPFRRKMQDEDAAPKPVPVLSILGDAITVVMRDVPNDVAIVSTMRASAPAVRLATVAPKAMDAVIVVGFPLGMPMPSTTVGIVSAPFQKVEDDPRLYAQFNVTGAPGNSGSSITNSRGEVISVLQAGWGRGWGSMVLGVLFNTLEQYRGYFESR